jgi:hypothetical protein
MQIVGGVLLMFRKTTLLGSCLLFPIVTNRDGSYEQHHFEVDENNRTITIWAEWLRKGNEIFAGTYELSGAELRLSGKFVKARKKPY